MPVVNWLQRAVICDLRWQNGKNINCCVIFQGMASRRFESAALAGGGAEGREERMVARATWTNNLDYGFGTWR